MNRSGAIDMGRWLLVIVAVAAGAAALVLQHRYLAQQRADLERERQKLMASDVQPIEVLVASRDLAKDTPIDASSLKPAMVPERFVQPYAARNAHDILGLITAVPIAAGEQVLTTKLRRTEDVPTGATLSSVTPKGKRAVTIAVDTISGVGGFVRPGDVVDILWTAKMAGGGGGQDSGQVVTLTLFQDVSVLAVGRDIAMPKKSDDAKDKDASGQFTVTLALTPQETSFLLVAREQGRIQLSLRPRNDTSGQAAVPPADMNTLMAAVAQAQGAAAPTKQGRSVEVYKGLERSVVVLPDEQQTHTP